MSFFTFIEKACGNPFDIGIGREVLSPQSIFKSITYSLEDFRKENLYIPFQENPEVWPQTPPDTNSMDGLFDYGNHLTYLHPKTPGDLRTLCNWVKPGDDLIYDSGNGWIIHRIYSIGNDGRRYFTFCGINNSRPDPYIVRDEHLKAVLVRVDY